jgi:putative hydrolase of the HAD superfamily
VFVGDRPLDDIYGAQQVGMRAVLRPNNEVPGHDVTPDGVIGSVPELITLVDAWR